MGFRDSDTIIEPIDDGGAFDSGEGSTSSTSESAANALAAANSAAAALASASLASADKVQTALDRIAVADDLVLTNQDTIDTAADLVLTNADVELTNADVVLAEADKVQTGLDRAATNADVVLTHADVVLTNADVELTNDDVVLTHADVELTNDDVVLTHADVVLTNADVGLTNADVVLTNEDVGLTNADVLLTNADVVLTHADVELTHDDVVLTNADVALAEADKVQTGLDRVATNADVVLTHADVVLTNADVGLTNADVLLTNADVELADADKVQTGLDRIAVAADLVLTNQDTIDTAADLGLTNADVVLTHADVVLTNADVALAEADKVQTGLDRIAVAADLVLTNQDTIDTAADLVLTNADVVLTNADVVLTNADVVLTNADVVLAEADKVQTGLDRVATGNSATSATTSASTATTKASEASTSATNAATSASTATTKASEASTSATNAATSATAAQTAETNAETAETNALASENAAATSETNAGNSATASALSATGSSNSQIAAASSAAAAAAVFDQFDDTYLGAKSSAPTVDNDGNALVTGALYFDTTLGAMQIWDGSVWIAASAAGTASITNYNFTATAGQVSFSGSDDNSKTLSYTVNSLILTLNGVVLEDGTDYTATNGSVITLSVAAVLNDELNIIAFKTFTTADMVSASNGGTFQGNVDFAAGIDVTGNITVTGTVDGRDVAADGTKLSGIEDNATSDQTGAEIKTAYEAETNAFTDAQFTKLSNIEELADVTDTANVVNSLTAGSNITIAANGTISGSAAYSLPTSSPTVLGGVKVGTNLAISGTGVLSSTNTTYSVGDGGLTQKNFTTTLKTKLDAIAEGATNVTNNNQLTNGAGYTTSVGDITGVTAGSGITGGGTSGTVTVTHGATSSQASLTALTGAAVVSDIDLDGFGHVTNLTTRNMTLANLGYTGETNATADQTAAQLLTAIKTVDGSGSGLDADLLDGQHASAFAAASHTHSYLPLAGGTVTGDVTFAAGANIHRSAFSSGFLVGGHNNIGSTAAKINPIYTIGSSYQPTETTLANMYGIGFASGTSHPVASISSMLGSGWGMFVAADGDARIGLNGTNGNIELTGTVDGVDIAARNGVLTSTTNTANAALPKAGGTLTGDLTIPDKIIHAGDTDTYFQFHGANLSRMVLAGAEVQEWGGGYTLFNDNVQVNLGSSSDFRMYFNGADTVFRNYAHANGDVYFQGEGSDGVNENALALDFSGTASYVRLFQNDAEKLRTTSGGAAAMGLFIGNLTTNPHNAGALEVGGANGEKIVLSGAAQPFIRFQEGTTDKAYIQWQNDGFLQFRNQETGNFRFRSSGTSTSVKLQFEASDGDIYGAVYATHNNEVGLLDNGSDWAYRIQDGSIHEWLINGTTEMSLTTATLDMKGNTITEVEDIGLRDRLYHDGDSDTYLDFDTNQVSIAAGGYTPLYVNTTGVRLGDSGNGYFQPVSGNYGSIQIDGGNHGGYEGYSIGARAVFMHNNSSNTGIFNDVENEWLFLAQHNGYARMYYNGTHKIETTNTGVTVTGDLNSTSDIRYKKNIEAIDGALDKVKSLKGVTFEWDNDAFRADENTKKPNFTRRATGVIAQDVEKVLPEAVCENEDGMKNVAYGNMVGLLIEAIKEQQVQIDELKAQLNS